MLSTEAGARTFTLRLISPAHNNTSHPRSRLRTAQRRARATRACLCSSTGRKPSVCRQASDAPGQDQGGTPGDPDRPVTDSTKGRSRSSGCRYRRYGSRCGSRFARTSHISHVPSQLAHVASQVSHPPQLGQPGQVFWRQYVQQVHCSPNTVPLPDLFPAVSNVSTVSWSRFSLNLAMRSSRSRCDPPPGWTAGGERGLDPPRPKASHLRTKLPGMARIIVPQHNAREGADESSSAPSAGPPSHAGDTRTKPRRDPLAPGLVHRRFRSPAAIAIGSAHRQRGILAVAAAAAGHAGRAA
jgi:hypothetical protein